MSPTWYIYREKYFQVQDGILNQIKNLSSKQEALPRVLLLSLGTVRDVKTFFISLCHSRNFVFLIFCLWICNHFIEFMPFNNTWNYNYIIKIEVGSFIYNKLHYYCLFLKQLHDINRLQQQENSITKQLSDVLKDKSVRSLAK